MDIEPFSFQIEVDDLGIIRSCLSGAFDVTTWAKTRDAVIARDVKGINLNNRPIIADISQLSAPIDMWKEHIKGMRKYEEERGIYFGRNAVITGERKEAIILARYYAALITAEFQAPREIKIFKTFDEGYAWVIEGWPGDVSADPSTS